MIGLLLGIGSGLFFGEYCGRLAILGNAFIDLLQMTVLPYIAVSLVANLGRLSIANGRRLLLVGGGFVLLFVGIALVFVAVLPASFPEWKSGAFYSASLTPPPAERPSLIPQFITSNFFAALAEDQVPAVVVICLLLGLALSQTRRRDVLLVQLDALTDLLMGVTQFITKLTPLGIFAIAASTVGTASLAELHRLQSYFVVYTAGALLLGLLVYPLLVCSVTPFRYREILQVSRDAMLTAFATGKLIIVLPLLIQQTEDLFQRRLSDRKGDAIPSIDVLYPLAYPFPSAGKLLGMLFIPFAAWFLGTRMSAEEYPGFLIVGAISYFGGPLLATPYLLDYAQLPHDMFQLFMFAGVYTGRLGDALSVMHLLCLTVLTTCLLKGEVRWQSSHVLGAVGTIGVASIILIGGLRMVLARTVPAAVPKEAVLAKMQLLERPVKADVLTVATPNPDPLGPQETLRERIERRGKLRVGYNPERLPFAYFNERGNLVGYDINLAHILAADLGVQLEFVPYDRVYLRDQLIADHFDLVMSGLVGSMQRSLETTHTDPYLEVHLGFIVADHRVRQFKSLESIRQIDALRIAHFNLSDEFLEPFRRQLPEAEFVGLDTSAAFFDNGSAAFDALLTSVESGFAYSLIHPDFEAVIPVDPQVSVPLFYAVGAKDREFRDFLDYWIMLKRDDGTTQAFYDHWILGKFAEDPQPQWSVIRNVLGWVE